MRNLLIIFVTSALMISCAASKSKQANANSEAKENVEMNPAAVKGIIRDHSMQDCGFLIELKMNEEILLLEPLKLPESYHKEGASILFVYRDSRRPSNCPKALPIVIDEIID